LHCFTFPVARTRYRPFLATSIEVDNNTPLGKGNFGEVFLGTIRRTGERVAVKTDKTADMTQLMREADLIGQFRQVHTGIPSVW
jgi:hypothetical protein